MLVVSRDLMRIAADGGRIGSLSASTRAARRRRRAVAEAEECKDFEGVDVAVVGEADLDARGSSGARRSGS